MSNPQYKTVEPIKLLDDIMQDTSRTIEPSLRTQINTKYKTFTNFNYRETYRDRRFNRKRKAEESKQLDKNIANTLASFMLNTLGEPEEKVEKKERKKKSNVAEELAGVKS